MQASEKLKHIVLLALSDAVIDMDEYYLYFLVPITQYHCNGTAFVFGILLVGKEVTSFIAQPLAGWIVDVTERQQHYILFLAAVVQLLTAAVMVFFGQYFEIIALVSVMLAHKMSTTLTETSMWKIVKMRCQVIFGIEAEEKQERVISFVGVNQHIWSNTYESAFLAAVFLFMNYSSVSEQTYTWARWMIVMSILIGDLLIVIIASMPVFFCFLPGCLFTPPHIGHASVGTLAAGAPASAQSETANLLQHSIQEEKEEESVSIPTQHLSSSKLRRGLRISWEFVKEKFLALYYGRLAIHTIIQAWLLFVFTEVVEYPMTFAEAFSGEDIDCHEHPDLCTTANFCGGSVKNLMEVSLLGDVAYTIGAIGYFLFLLKCPPRWFYSAVVPISAILFASMMASFWFLNSAPHTIAFILLSIATVGPTYLERYNFYFWMSVIDAKHFGFIYSIYGIGQNVLHLTVSLVLALFGNDIDSGSTEFTVLLATCIAMMGCIFFYSSWFGCAYASHFSKRVVDEDAAFLRKEEEEEEEEEGESVDDEEEEKEVEEGRRGEGLAISGEQEEK